MFQTSWMRSTSRPSRKGFRWRSMAAATAKMRWVKVAQPTPYKPGSDVMTLTMARRDLPGWVRMTLTSRMVTGFGMDLDLTTEVTENTEANASKSFKIDVYGNLWGVSPQCSNKVAANAGVSARHPYRVAHLLRYSAGTTRVEFELSGASRLMRSTAASGRAALSFSTPRQSAAKITRFTGIA